MRWRLVLGKCAGEKHRSHDHQLPPWCQGRSPQKVLNTFIKFLNANIRTNKTDARRTVGNTTDQAVGNANVEVTRCPIDPLVRNRTGDG